MKQILVLFVALTFLAAPAFAKPKDVLPSPLKTGPATDKSFGKAVDKIQAEAVDAIADQLLGEDGKTTTKVVKVKGSGMPPGLAKKGKMPPGLAKQGKIPPGWQKGGTTVIEVETEKKQSLVRRFINKLFGEKKADEAKKE